MSKNERERKLCVHSKYYPFKSIQQHTIPSCLLGGQWTSIYRHYNVFFSSSFQCFSGWNAILRILEGYPLCLWLCSRVAAVCTQRGLAGSFLLLCVFKCLRMIPFTRYYNVTTLATQALRKWLTRMRWHMCPECMMERKHLYLWGKCLCFWSERMVVCVSVWLHNPKVLACVTILRC